MKPNTIKPAAQSKPTKHGLFTFADVKHLKSVLSEESLALLLRLKDSDPFPHPLQYADGQEFDQIDWEPISLKSWDDDGYRAVHQIGKNVYVYDEDSNTSVHAANGVIPVLQEAWYNSGLEDCIFEEWLAAFDVQPDLVFAKRNCDEPVRVWLIPHYAEKRNTDHYCRWARDENDQEILEFESYSDARKWINQDKKSHHGYPDKQYPKGYYLYKNNEVAPLEYKICEEWMTAIPDSRG